MAFIVAYLMKLSEQHCDVICRRFQEYFGVNPILESTGEPHDFSDTSDSKKALEVNG